MFAKKIQVAALSLALLVPAESAFAHHSQLRGAVIGGVAGALIGHGPRSALVGAAVGTGVQYVRNQEERNKAQQHAARHHHKKHHRHNTR
jgi:uncharacterized protein YcfJ